MAKQDILESARALQPLKQGSLDSLCGVYSIINAIQLTIFPERKLSHGQQARLFRHGISVYRRSRNLAELVRIGMTERAWCELCDELVTYANAEFDLGVGHRPLLANLGPLHVRSALATIKRHVDTGYPALIILAGHYNHFTVVSGYRLGRLWLFDSGPYHWVSNRSIGTEHSRPHARHLLSPTGAIAMFKKSAPLEPRQIDDG